MTELGEGVSVSIVPSEPDKELKAEVIEVEFLKPYKACINQATISAPHWPATVDAVGLSEKAVVLGFDKAPHKVKVKVKVTSKGYSGEGKLIGTLGGSVAWEGSISLSSGEHTVEVTSTSAPAYLSWVKGPIYWGVEASDQSLSIGRTPVEIFFIFSDPTGSPFFSKKGVWIEALRFLFTKGHFDSIASQPEAVSEVTQVCFSLPNHKYEREGGNPGYGGGITTRFQLTSYMSPGVNRRVNCYDQTYAVIVFSGALGAIVGGLFLQPFGFIRPTNLVGWGRCNNPFVSKERLDFIESNPFIAQYYLEVDPQSPDRTDFGNHMFCEYSAKIYDACAGPARGSLDREGYVNATIDDVMPDGYSDSTKGTASGIKPIRAVGAGVDSVE